LRWYCSLQFQRVQSSMIDHDQNFKKLLSTFFVEFVQLFLPDVAAYLDTTSLEFVNPEVFTDVTAGDKHIADLVVKARFRGQETFFLVHVEHQSDTEADFPQRMFKYFARLHEKYKLPVYPVVLFSFDKPFRPEPKRYQIAFPGRSVLQFDYVTIQLNRLSWRKFAKIQNPVASALMVKMKIAPKDRPKVLRECRRLLATLKLDPAKAELIWKFTETYLKLSAEELKQYEREFAKLTPIEQEATMEFISSMRQEGRHEGKEELVARLIRRRFGDVPSQTSERLDKLSSDQLNELGEALFDFKTPADLEIWFSQHNPQ
jgi:predicted transposase/invertase (TIGR01784 family)